MSDERNPNAVCTLSNMPCGDLADALRRLAELEQGLDFDRQGNFIRMPTEQFRGVEARVAELTWILRAYVADEDRFIRGEGEPYGSITTETGIAARLALK